MSILRTSWFVATIATASLGCGADARPASGRATSNPVVAAPVRDTLVATRAGTAVWLVPGREGTRADGTPCDERLIELRRDSSVVRVPLLYTGEFPRITNDSTLEVALWLHCTPGELYRVNLRTGQPVKVRPAGGTQ